MDTRETMLHDPISAYDRSHLSMTHPLNALPSRLLAFALLACLSIPASAVRFYDVELILFENLDTTQVNNEVWPDETAAGEPSAIDLFGTRGDIPATSSGFDALGVAEKTLGGTAARLRNSSNYRPILHLAWRQPGLGSSEAIPVRIAGGRRYINPLTGLETETPEPPGNGVDTTSQPITAAAVGQLGNLTETAAPSEVDEIEGTIKIVLGRYLHVHTDLLFRRLMPAHFGIQPAPQSESADTESEPGSVTAPRSQDPAPASAQAASKLTGFRMQQKRRMRSSELHYIDHPAFGMIVEIRRAPEQNG